MKKVCLITLMAAFVMSLCLNTGIAESSLLTEFAENPYAFKSLAIGAFSTDPASAPSDEELTTMLRFAMMSACAHGMTPAHFVVVRDPEEQVNIVSGVAAFGEPIPASEGTVTILILGDAIRKQEVHEAAYNGWYSQQYYGIYDTGAAAAYLSLAAQSLGYSVHQVAGINLPLKELGEVNVFAAGGNFAFVTGENWDASKYLTSKDGKVDFTHTVGSATMDGQRMDIAANGNLNLLASIVIGKPADGIDAVSSSTTVTEGIETLTSGIRRMGSATAIPFLPAKSRRLILALPFLSLRMSPTVFTPEAPRVPALSIRYRSKLRTAQWWMSK